MTTLREVLFGSRRAYRRAMGGPKHVRTLFSKVQTILRCNTKFLGKMAEMERLLGGEYIFDRNFLARTTAELCALAHQVVYSLNAMTENGHPALYDRYQEIKSALEDILAEKAETDPPLTMLLSEADLESAWLVGPRCAALAELGERMDLGTPPGFVLTAKAFELLDLSGAGPNSAEVPDWLTQAVAQALTDMGAKGATGPLWLGLEAFRPGELESLAEVSIGQVWPEPKQVLAKAVELARGQLAGLEQGLAVSAMVLALPDIQALILADTSIITPEDVGYVRILTWPLTQTLHPNESEAQSFLIGRIHPYEVLEVKTDAGADLVPRETLRLAAKTAMSAQRLLAGPQRLLLALDGSGKFWTLGSLPGQDRQLGESADQNLAQALQGAKVLLSGGQTAQVGAGAGVVQHVREDDDPRNFAYGAVAVSRAASPGLSPILRRASAVVTEVGTPAGHLAAIARELRVPAIFGAGPQAAALPEGQVVTVDGLARKVYQGVVPALLAEAGQGLDLSADDPEYLMLRRLLRRISPLRLVDPQSPEFKPEYCRSLHDMVHYSHDRALDELLHAQTQRQDLRGYKTRRLDLASMDMRLLDIGGGISPQAKDPVALEDLICLPLRAFLAGLGRGHSWRTQPAALSVRDVFSGLDKTYAALSAPAEFAGGNLAIVAERYLNLSLRLGYHFSVIDAHVSENPNKNSIYFRFAGGLGDSAKRGRRVKLIASVLSALDFKTSLTGDLLVARLKIAERTQVETVLALLGELTAFTRQLDTTMTTDGDIADQAQKFSLAAAQTIRESEQGGQR